MASASTVPPGGEPVLQPAASEPGAPASEPLASAATELASDRTAMALERTILAEDRTLMAIVRTSLALISFGFTIYQFLGKLAQSLIGRDTALKESARNFGATLIFLGIVLLAAGLVSHFRGLAALRSRRGYLHERGLLRSPPIFRPTSTGVVALVLLALGVVSIVDMILKIGPLR